MWDLPPCGTHVTWQFLRWRSWTLSHSTRRLCFPICRQWDFPWNVFILVKSFLKILKMYINYLRQIIEVIKFLETFKYNSSITEKERREKWKIFRTLEILSEIYRVWPPCSPKLIEPVEWKCTRNSLQVSEFSPPPMGSKLLALLFRLHSDYQMSIKWKMDFRSQWNFGLQMKSTFMNILPDSLLARVSNHKWRWIYMS